MVKYPNRLDSRSAQVVIRNIKRIAASGRSVVCTIHQPSTPIFSAFDSLLLLQRGGETVFFGPCVSLPAYFQSYPGVPSLSPKVNPATWMLEVIGAGTTEASQSRARESDFHTLYIASELCASNEMRLRESFGERETDKGDSEAVDERVFGYSSSYLTQTRWLLYRAALTYWRNPSYTLGRYFVNIVIALIFASAFPQQDYSTYIAVVSRAAVIYITALFTGILGMMSVMPVAIADRAVFYREDQSKMYSTALYSLVYNIIEVSLYICVYVCIVHLYTNNIHIYLSLHRFHTSLLPHCHSLCRSSTLSAMTLLVTVERSSCGIG